MNKIKNKYSDILIQMSFPILMNYIVMTLFEVLDKAIVGNYSIDAFAAVGSVIGLLAGILVYIVKFYRYGHIKFKGAFNKKITRKLVKLYIPLLGQDIIEGTIFPIILTGIVSRLGVYGIASYNLLESVSSIMILPVYAFSTSAITLSIQKSFSNKEDNSKTILNTAIILSLFTVLIICIFIAIFPNSLLGLLTKDKELISTSSKIFILVIIFQVFNIFHQIYKSYLQGINNERFVFKFTSFISIISTLWIGILSMKFNLLGIYIGLCINNLIFAVVYHFKINCINSKLVY